MTPPDSKREQIFSKLRESLGARGDEPGRRGTVRARLERSPSGMLPERARTPRDDQPDLFASMLKRQGAVVNVLDRVEDLPKAIADQLAALNLPSRIRHGADPLIESLDWDGTVIERSTGPARGDDEVSLSRAIGGAAESGTLVLASGPENPSTLNFLPDAHFVIIRAEDIAGSFEDCWNAIRRTYGRGTMPRTVNLVSGPSATGDIEQTIVHGAHGPRRLAIFLIPEDQPAE